MSKAQHAVRAAKNRANWGTYAATRYAQKHQCLGAYRLACQLEVVV